MVTKIRCLVEIFFIQNNFISFDFGNFAIVVSYNSNLNTNEINLYFDDNYRKQFMGNQIFKIGITEILDSVEINPNSFEDIRKTALKLIKKRMKNDYMRLFYLLKMNFPKQVELYGK